MTPSKDLEMEEEKVINEEGDDDMIKIGILILAVFWILAFFGTTDVFLWVTGATGALICVLGLATAIFMWIIVKRIEKLEKKS